MTIFFGIVAVLIAGIFIFLQTDVFGQIATGSRLERIKKSPHFKDGKFNNEHFTPDLAEGVSYWDILKSYLKKVENKEPDFVLPSVKTDLKALHADNPQLVWFGPIN